MLKAQYDQLLDSASTLFEAVSILDEMEDQAGKNDLRENAVGLSEAIISYGHNIGICSSDFIL